MTMQPLRRAGLAGIACALAAAYIAAPLAVIALGNLAWRAVQ